MGDEIVSVHIEDELIIDDVTATATACFLEQAILGLVYSGRVRSRIKRYLASLHSVVPGDAIRITYSFETVYNDMVVVSQTAKGTSIMKVKLNISKGKEVSDGQ